MAKKGDKKNKIILASGKRRTAVARVRIMETDTNPQFRVNGQLIETWPNEFAKKVMMEPIILLGDLYKNNLNIKAKVFGGGWMGQAQAVKIALARALNEYYGSSQVTAMFNDYDRTWLSGDIRRTEPKKAGGRGARARFQKSYR